jgi:heat shock protein HspQ
VIDVTQQLRTGECQVKPPSTEEPASAANPTPGNSGIRMAKFRVGDVVRHRIYPFRGIVFDIDPVFNSTEEWWHSIPAEIRPSKNQPYYHLLAENDKSEYIAYVSEQNLLPDTSGTPLRHPQVKDLFVNEDGRYRATFLNAH